MLTQNLEWKLLGVRQKQQVGVYAFKVNRKMIILVTTLK